MTQRSKSNQIQELKLEQRQSLSQYQVQFVRLLELPTEGLEERVRAELLENPALEEADDMELPMNTANQDSDNEQEEDFDIEEEYGDDVITEEYTSEADEHELAALGDYSSEDDIPDYALREDNRSSDYTMEEIPFSAATSFYELLKEQLVESPLNEQEREVAEYLIGSFDDDGLIRKDLSSIIEELAIYHGIYTDMDEVLKVLHVIQGFDPPGVGAQSLQECLLIQLRQRPDTPAKQLAQLILERFYDDFSYKRWERILQSAGIDETALEEAVNELTRLNPRPGSSLSETVGKSQQQIVPDFIIRTDENENIILSLNDSNVPELRISPDFDEMVESYSKEKSTRENQEALLFLQQKIDNAQMFINLVEQRKRTLTVTMQAIIRLQRDFFLSGDEQLLKPMLMKDVANAAGVDVSTVSRVASSKYAETDFGTYPLKFFFGGVYHKPAIALNKEGRNEISQKGLEEKQEETSQRQIRGIIQECVNQEDKQHPMTDEELMGILKQRGFDLARRTVAKYRQQLGIPVARMRREISPKGGN